MHATSSPITITALIRTFWDYSTLRASLESIQGVFDDIVVLYHDNDEKTREILLELQNLYNLRLIWYLPPFDITLIDTDMLKRCEYVKFLVDYYEFWRQQVRTDYFVKIDTDQIYFTEELKGAVQYVKKHNKRAILSGFNIYLQNNIYCIDMQNPINWKRCDTVIVKKGDIYFAPGWTYEVQVFKDRFWRLKKFFTQRFFVWTHWQQFRRPGRLSALKKFSSIDSFNLFSFPIPFFLYNFKKNHYQWLIQESIKLLEKYL